MDSSGTIDVVMRLEVIHPPDVSGFVETNTRGTHNVTAWRAAGVRRLVHLSSTARSGPTPTPTTFRNDEPANVLGYGRSKCSPSCACWNRSRTRTRRGDRAAAVVLRPAPASRQTTFFTMVRTGRFR